MFKDFFTTLRFRAKSNLLREVIATFEASDRIQDAADNGGGALKRSLTYIANYADELGEPDVCQMAREIRDENMPYFERLGDDAPRRG